jgi:pimeloyl-ACP methyl ester carboxylesterase
MLPDQMAADLPATAGRIDTAFFVIQDQDDVVTPTKTAIGYVELVGSPKKEPILIPNAGHFAFMTHSTEFLAALVDKVHPAAIARGA